MLLLHKRKKMDLNFNIKYSVNNMNLLFSQIEITPLLQFV